MSCCYVEVLGKDGKQQVKTSVTSRLKCEPFSCNETLHGMMAVKDGVEEEYKWHVNDWKKRLSAYERIRWDGFAVQENLRRVFHGEAPKQMIQPTQTLALPSPGQQQ